MFPKYQEIELPLLFEIAIRGGSVKPIDHDQYGRSLYDALADYFNLSEDARIFLIFEKDGTPRSKWENMVRWARKELKEKGLITSSKRGVWSISSEGERIVGEFETEELTKGSIRGRRSIDISAFRKMQQEAIETGELGEKIVIKKEQDWLYTNGRTDLADKVTQISTLNVAAGYDILSFDLTGNEKFIETKATVGFSFAFELTKNELHIARNLKNQYWLYRVTRVRSANPSILKLQNPALHIETGSLILTPSSYRVRMSENFQQTKVY